MSEVMIPLSKIVISLSNNLRFLSFPFCGKDFGSGISLILHKDLSPLLIFNIPQGPRVGPTCSHDLGIHLKWLGQRLEAQRSSVHAQSVRNPRKSNLVNCGWFYGFDGWIWFERYGYLITDQGDVLLMDQEEHVTYQEAITGPGSGKWLEAMGCEHRPST